MFRSTHTNSYETDTDTASSPSSTSTSTQPNFRAPSTSNPTNETPTLPITPNTKLAPPPNPLTALRHPLPTPLFRHASTVWWGPGEAIVRHIKQTTYSTVRTSFLYTLLLPSGITRNVHETLLETSAPPSPPPHSTAPTPFTPVHVLDVAP